MKKKKKNTIIPRILHPTSEEVYDRFLHELRIRTNAVISLACEKNGKFGVVALMEFSDSPEYGKLIASEKISLIRDWESKGRNMNFLKQHEAFNVQSLLMQKYPLSF